MALLIILQIVTVCYAQQSTSVEAAPVLLDAKAFQAKLAKEKGAVLLDVRTPAEVQEGVIPGATAIDYKAPDFTSRISKLDKNKPYFVYCKGGGRSARAVEEMNRLGFKKLYALKEGYDDWLESGLPTRKP